jgi:hypothetical protein
MTDTNITTPDDFPAFDEATTRAEIVNYDPDRAIGEAGPSRAQASGAQASFVVTMLAPEDRGDISQRLAAIADPAERSRMEAKLVEPVVRKLAHAANIRRGHPNGTAYDQEVAAVTNTVWELEGEDDRLAKELNEVARYETTIDPQTGQPTPKPIYVIAGAERDRVARRRVDIARHIVMLEGPEGAIRLKRAEDAELAKRAEQHEDARVLFEASRRAREMVAEGRIEELARAKAKSMRNNL